jgi:hypothetical protein
VFCRDWLLNKCQHQYRCSFVHGDLEYDPPVTGRHPPPVNPETCRTWLRNECPYGYACYFTHGDLEYDHPTQDKDAHSAPRTAVVYIAILRLVILIVDFRHNMSRQFLLWAVQASIRSVDTYRSNIYTKFM